MKRSMLWTVVSLLLVSAFVLTGCGPKLPTGPVTLQLWNKESGNQDSINYVQALADAYTAEHPNFTIEMTTKDTEGLREDFQTAALAGSPPSVLWTVNDHAGPFTAADIIIPVDKLFDLGKFTDNALTAVELNGQHWGVPITNGNHLMLYYNKDLVPKPPATTDELLTMAEDLKAKGVIPLAYNTVEPFWLVPWLGGFGGSVFAEDGVTPTLNTPAMVSTLAWLKQLKDQGVVPPESDYNAADTLFKEGKAAMIINGDWTLGTYEKPAPDGLGDKLGVARIPTVSSTGKPPAPYTSGVFFMIPKGLDADTQAVVVDFIKWATNEANQLDMVSKLARLPALKTALQNQQITSDPFLAGSADQMVVGVPMPTVLEMRCNWDSMKPEMAAVLSGDKSPEDAAAAMQSAAEACIQTLE